MARFEVTGLEDVIEQLQREATRLQSAAPEAVEAGAQVLETALRAATPRRTGGLSASVKAHGVKQDGSEYACEVYPDGTDERGERYATIGFVLEYGRSNMAPRPWMRPTVDAVSEEVVSAMAEVLQRDG